MAASGPTSNPETIIIGAGPVGLLLCIELIDNRGCTGISVYEQRSETDTFSRNQQMLVENANFNKFPKEVRDNLLKNPNSCKIYRPPKLMKNYCFTEPFPAHVESPTSGTPPNNGYSIMTSTLQRVLYNYIKKECPTLKFIFESEVTKINKDNTLNIKIKMVVTKIPFTTLVISSGPKIINNPYSIDKKVDPSLVNLYGAAINIKLTTGKDLPKTIDKYDKTYDDKFTKATLQHRFRFFRQQDDNLYVGINLSETEYDSYVTTFGMKNRNDLEITDASNPDIFDYIANIIAVYTDTDKKIVKNTIEIDKGQFSVFKIDIFTLNKALHSDSKAHVYIIGDAVQNTHFFTGYGVNFGFDTARRVATIINKNTYTVAENKAYQDFIDVQKAEIVKRVKSIVIDFTKTCSDDEINDLEAKNDDLDLSKFSKDDKCKMIQSKTTSPPPSAPGPSEDTIKKGIMSLHNLKGNVESTTQGELVDEIRKFLQISNCAQLFSAVSVNGDISSKVEDYSNIFQIYFELTNQEEDENTWKKIDTQYEKIIAKYYELAANLSIQRGGIRSGLKATNIFNTSANTINANNVRKIDDKIGKLLSELQRNKEYIDGLYSNGTVPTSTVIAKIAAKFAAETARIEASANTLISDRDKLVAEETPDSMFKNLLNKFKTEAQLISWLEKAKIENIEITAKYKAANQKFKSLSTIKKTVDKYIENMKKTLNSKCQLIQDYSRLVDSAKPLESIQQNVLELCALRLDPARGSNNIQLFLEKLQITPDEFIEKLLFIKDLIAKTAPTTAPTTAPPTAPGGGARFTADGDVCDKVKETIKSFKIIDGSGKTIEQKKSITEKELEPLMRYTGTTYEELKECIDEINRDLPPSDQISMPPQPAPRGPSVFKKAASNISSVFKKAASNISSVGSDAANLGKNAARIAATGVATGAKAAASGVTAAATGVATGVASGVTAAATGVATGVASGVTAAATGIATGTKTATGKIVKGLSTTESYRNFKTLEEEMSLFFSIDDPYINKIKEIFEKYTSDTDMTPDQLYRILTSNDVIAGGGLHGGAPIIIPGGIAVIWQKIIVKYIIIATMIKEKSWKPITDEIFRKKQESEKLLSEINDRIEEVKEREQAPVDNSTYFNLYKTTMKEEEDTLKSEVAKIEAETVILLKKVPEEIAKIKEAAKVTFQQPNNNQNQSQDFKNLNLEQLKAKKKEFEAEIQKIIAKGNTATSKDKKNLERYKGQLRNLDQLISQKQKGTTPAAPGGGKRVYAHSTRRQIK